jgi:hypothetical protein
MSGRRLSGRMSGAVASAQDKLNKSLNQKGMIGDTFKMLEANTGVQRLYIAYALGGFIIIWLAFGWGAQVELEMEELRRERRRSAREGEEWSWINRAIMGASGIRYNKDASTWRSECGVDRAMNTNFHCSLTRDARRKTGLTMFFASCAYKGIKPQEAFSRFVLGLDGKGDEVKMEEYRERGRALATVFKASMARFTGTRGSGCS